MLTKRMAMRRMNEMWRRMALTLVFCVLLFHTCQGESTEFSTSTSTITSFTKVSENTIDENSTVLKSTVSTLLWSVTPPTTATTVASTDLSSTTSDKNLTTTEANKVNNHTDSLIQVSEELQDHSTVQGSRESQTDTTTTTERAHESLVTSNATTTQIVVHMTSKAHAKGNAGESVELNNEIQQDQFSKVNEESQTSSPPQGNSKNVFVAILVCGLVLAAALIGLYIKRNHCPTRASGGMKLADESCMADEDNQGNTLVSVAPLNPPENQEKPSLNGESLEAVKIQNPPAATNGHSTAKADTEL